jgi:UDP-GlcNAc:undecaprenyl-phosphate GlcNAc-1-phosphate transferase
MVETILKGGVLVNSHLIYAFFASLITVLLVTPFVIKLAFKIGAVDKPNARKVHQRIIPRLGGLAIFIGVIVGYFVSGLYQERMTTIVVGAIIIVVVGILDDMYELSPKLKLLGQVAAAVLIVKSGLTIEILNIPFMDDYFELGILSYPLTVIWIVGITNAINLIDGLDGLSAGISSIALATIAFMALQENTLLIFTLAIVIIASTIGFLFYNFHPAKIFMGDTGALFLGYCISVLSLLGLYKSVTLFSFIVPIIILGVPIFDTTFAIIRRIVNKKPISAPDKSHLHHRLLALGFSHRKTVLLIYTFGIFFSLNAIVFSSSTLWASILILFVLIFIGEIIAELIGLVHEKYKPIITMYRKVKGRQDNY